MTQSDLTIREVTEDDFDIVRELYRAVWGYNRPIEFDRWRYLSNPEGIIAAAVAMDGDRAAGFYTVWPAPLKLGKERVSGAQSMDTMTHPDYQGRGLFVKLALACFEICQGRGIEVLYGFPNPLSYPGFVRRLNWDHTGDVTHWIRPLRPSRHPRMPRGAGTVADGLAALLPRGKTGGYEIRTGKPEEVALKAVLEEWCNERGLCRIDRTPRWLGWRLSSDAANGYEWVTAHHEGTLAAAGAWGMRDESWGEVADGRAHLVELMGGDKRARAAVLAAIIGRARAQGAVVLETLSNVDTVTKCLRGAGFVRHRQAPLIVRGLTGRNFDANIHDHAAWRIMGSDIDTF